MREKVLEKIVELCRDRTAVNPSDKTRAEFFISLRQLLIDLDRAEAQEDAMDLAAARKALKEKGSISLEKLRDELDLV